MSGFVLLEPFYSKVLKGSVNIEVFKKVQLFASVTFLYKLVDTNQILEPITLYWYTNVMKANDWTSFKTAL